MATIDFGKKCIIYGESFMPSGDIDADMEIIRRFYAGAKGRHPERQGEIRLRPREDEAAANLPSTTESGQPIVDEKSGV
jgi:hypothetical protein